MISQISKTRKHESEISTTRDLQAQHILLRNLRISKTRPTLTTTTTATATMEVVEMATGTGNGTLVLDPLSPTRSHRSLFELFSNRRRSAGSLVGRLKCGV